MAETMLTETPATEEAALTHSQLGRATERVRSILATLEQLEPAQLEDELRHVLADLAAADANTHEMADRIAEMHVTVAQVGELVSGLAPIAAQLSEQGPAGLIGLLTGGHRR